MFPFTLRSSHTRLLEGARRALSLPLACVVTPSPLTFPTAVARPSTLEITSPIPACSSLCGEGTVSVLFTLVSLALTKIPDTWYALNKYEPISRIIELYYMPHINTCGRKFSCERINVALLPLAKNRLTSKKLYQN